MKCGIITYHFANNYGAMLQCYALKAAIQGLGHAADVFNFASDRQLDNNSVYRRRQGVRGYVKNLLLLPFAPGRRRRAAAFDRFRRQALGCDGPRLGTNDALKAHIDRGGYDVVISGSDQVWNPNVFDFEDAFFYPFELRAKKAGYAVSLGSATAEQLGRYADWMRDFACITAREQSSAQLLSALVRREVREVADPVLLLDRAAWDSCVERREGGYLLCYFVREEDMAAKLSRARALSKKLNLALRIVNLRITRHNLRRPIAFDLDPFAFLSALAGADYVYTDSFHGTAFSLIFERNFTAVESASERGDGRKRNLLDRVGLTGRIRAVGDSDEALAPIDYARATPAVDALRRASTAALREMLALG